MNAETNYYEMAVHPSLMKSPVSSAKVPQALSEHKSSSKRRKPAFTDNFNGNPKQELIFPSTGEEIARLHSGMLTAYEKKEVLKYSEVYYLGTAEAKEQRNFKSIFNSRSNSMSHTGNANNGFDRYGGLYKLIVGDHIAFRYEVLKELDKGAFGQVVRCLDHKTK